MFNALQGLISALQVLVSLAGIGVSLLFLGRSRWAAVLAGAFTLEAFVGIGYRVVIFLMNRGSLAADGREATFLLLNVAGLASGAAVVAGVGFVLSALPAPPRRPAVEPGA